ncbi:MAG: DUF368 domain-containing protein [Defluviitaleaceae bacterium]|nr:DUF368 domain-containing protein [Defluviitaleaceae bacterium]
MNLILLGIKGIVMGAANVMPGVSGATLAVIFRLYDKLLDAVNHLFTDTKNSLKFLIPFGIGMAVGIVAMGDIINTLLVNFPLQVSGFIAGLIAGSIPFLHNEATAKDGKKPYLYVIAIIAGITIVLLEILTPTPEPYLSAEFNIGFAVLVFIGGIFAAAAMIIPGVSGAMVLILFGLFPLVMNTISLIRSYLMTPLDFSLLTPIFMVSIPLGLGMIVGILAASRLIALLLKKFHSQTYFAILGMVFGTIFIMFNDVSVYQQYDGLTPFIIVGTIIAFVCGGAASLLLGNKKKS